MIIICKLTLSTFRLGIPIFSKISFTMTVDRNVVIKLYKSRNSNVEIAKRLDMNRSTVWKIVNKFQETGNTLDRPGHGRKRSVRSLQLLKNTREKLRRNPRLEEVKAWPPQPEWANPPCIRCWGTIRGWSLWRCCLARSLRPIMWSWGTKNAEKVFTNEKKFDIQQAVSQQNARVWASSSSTEERIVTRCQNPQSVMVWSVVTETENFQRYIADILEGCLLPWAKNCFQEVPWFLQQDSAPSHASTITQSWIQW